MAAAPGPAVQSVAWQEETDAPYLFVPGDVTAVDGVTSIAPTGGTAGRWLLGSEIISIKPIDGIVDDGARITSILNAIDANAGLRLLRGNAGQAFQIKTSTQLTARSPWLIGTADTVIHMDMAKDLSQSHNAFWLEPLTDATITATTLAANVVEGTVTLTTHAATGITAGKWILVTAAADFQQVFKVLSVAGAADPFTITLDAPIAFPFLSGATVVGVIPGQNARFEGNGALITGTGSAAFQLRSIVGLLRGWRFDSDLDWGMGVFDTGSRDTVIEDIDGHNATGSGIGTDGAVRATLRRITLRRVATYGLSVNSVRFLSIEDCLIDGGTIGLAAGSLLSGGVGVRDFAVSNSYFERQTTYGVLVTDGSQRGGFTNCHFDFSTGGSGAVVAAAGGGTPDGIAFTNCLAFSNANAGFYSLSGVMSLLGCRAEKNGAGDVANYGDLVISTGTCHVTGFVSRDPVAQSSISFLSTGTLRASGLDLGVTRNALWFGIQLVAGATLYASGVVFRGVAGQNHQCIFNNAGNVAWLENATHVTTTTGYNDAAGATFTRGPNVQLPTYAANGSNNFGTFTLNGVTEVDVAGNFPLGALVTWTLKTVGGTPGNSMPYFDKAPIAGHFYVKSTTAGANDVYNWQAVPDGVA